MHRVRFQLLAAIAAILVGAFSPRAIADANTGVPVRVWTTGITDDLSNSPYFGSCHLWGTFVPTTPGASGYAESWGSTDSPNTSYTTSLGTVNVLPGVQYAVYSSGTCTPEGSVYVVPPPGYDAVIEGMYRNSYQLTSVVNFRILPKFEGPPGAAGFASTISGAQVNWRMSLGFLRNGNEAGSLQLADPATGADWSNIFTPAALSYASTSAEVYVYQPNNILRQIVANQVAVDIVTLSSTSYEIRCYNPKQVQSYVPFTFSGQPFVTYRVERGTPDAAHANDSTAVVLKLTRETRNVTDTYQTNAPIVRREVMTLQRSGTWPNFLWIKNDWTLDGQTPVVSTVVQSGGTTQNRTETITVKGAGGATAASLTRSYTLYTGCGEVLTTETLGTTNSRTTNFAYYTSTSSPGSLGYVSSVTLPGGGWESYNYYDSGNPTSLSGGKVQFRYRPFVSNPATPGTIGAEQTVYSYESDPFNFNNRLSQITTSVSGGGSTTFTGVTWFAYDNTDAGANDGVVLVTRTTADQSPTKMRYYSEDTADEYKRSQPVSVQQADGTLKTFAYEVGRWDGATFTVGSTFDATNNASRITTMLGTANSSGALTLVANRSTKVITIRDIRALPARDESYIWNGSTWQLTTWTNYVYNFAGLLISRTSSNGAMDTATWDGQQKTSETDETGSTVSYTYDVAGRIATTTRAAAGSVPALVTSFTYDALGNVIEQRVGASGGEQLVSTKTFDDATRPASETPAGLGATTYSYDVANRAKTTTNPDGGTITETTALDGRLLSKTGSAIVAEFYTYGLESVAGSPTYGQRWTQINYGTATSTRWKKTWQDALDRVVTTNRPTFGGQSTYVEQNTYAGGYAGTSSSHLIKTTKTGVAATLYQYDAFGVLNRNGLDVDNNASLTLASNDRITDANTTFEYYNNAWWERTDTIAYRTAGQSTPTTMKIVRKRLSGFPANRLEETQETDAYGNVSITTKDVDRASSKVTVTVSRTGQTWKAVSVSVNGLVVQATGTDGLTTTTAYDALGRKVSVTDSRNNTTRTTYYPGTQLVQSVIDATNTTVSTTTYDNMGRAISEADAANHKTYTSYDLQGHVIRKWGDGTYPVSYGYDAVFGDRVSMSTYRGGSGWDQSAWPGTGSNSGNSPGTADTTTWAYDQPSGLLASKTDAAGRTVSYAYDTTGRLTTRTWARGVTTTYTYDASTGDQTAIQYSDGTPNLAYTYNRAGESSQVTLGGSGGIVESFDRDAVGKITADHLDATLFGGRTTTYKLNSAADGTKGRILGYTLANGGTTEQDLTYAYDPTTDRFASLAVGNTGVATAAHNFRYAYLTNSFLISALSVDGSPFTISRTFESQRDVLTSVAGQWSTATRTRYDYTVNALGQRTSVKQSGDAFVDYGDNTFQQFSYNSRSELTGAVGYLGSDVSQATQPLPGRNLNFAYDNIGNRQSTNRTTDSAQTDHYTSNALNQIVTKENHAVQVSGTADATANVAIDGRSTAASRQGRYWNDEVPVANSTGPWRGPMLAYVGKSGAGVGGSDLVRIDARLAQIAAAAQAFSYDNDGNLTSDGLWDYTWDAENRLVAMQTSVAAATAGFPNQRLEFKYDYLGRRIEKLVRGGWNGSSFTTITLQRRFIYDGWNLIAEYAVSGPSSLVLSRSYAWGLDIARTLSDAGGVGALLQIADHVSGKSYFACYDGNGNIAGLLNADSGSIAAAYEYSPYGEQLRSDAGDSAIADQPFRFSTKYTDAETGLLYYGHRYYDPRNGRFVGRDPIEEKGGLNLYAFCLNNSINTWDVLGNIAPGEPGWDAYFKQMTVNLDPQKLSVLLDQINAGQAQMANRGNVSGYAGSWGDGGGPAWAGDIWITCYNFGQTYNGIADHFGGATVYQGGGYLTAKQAMTPAMVLLGQPRVVPTVPLPSATSLVFNNKLTGTPSSLYLGFGPSAPNGGAAAIDSGSNWTAGLYNPYASAAGGYPVFSFGRTNDQIWNGGTLIGAAAAPTLLAGATGVAATATYLATGGGTTTISGGATYIVSTGGSGLAGAVTVEQAAAATGTLARSVYWATPAVVGGTAATINMLARNPPGSRVTPWTNIGNAVMSGWQWVVDKLTPSNQSPQNPPMGSESGGGG